MYPLQKKDAKSRIIERFDKAIKEKEQGEFGVYSLVLIESMRQEKENVELMSDEKAQDLEEYILEQESRGIAISKIIKRFEKAIKEKEQDGVSVRILVDMREPRIEDVEPLSDEKAKELSEYGGGIGINRTVN